MSRRQIALGLALVGGLFAQDAEDRRKAMEIRARAMQGQPVTAEEKAFVQKVMKAQRAAFLASNPPRPSTGLVPLPDLVGRAYKGEPGGLYPGGRNTPPEAHAAAGRRIARSVTPIRGKIVMVSTGMSNTTQESQAFASLLTRSQGVNPQFLFVDCAQGGQTAAITGNPSANYWRVAEARLTAAGVKPDQVQIAWVKQANANPTEGFPGATRKLAADLADTLHNLRDKYPNLKIAFLSSRIYGGWAETPLNPEPYAYEGAFAVRWTVARQLDGSPDLNYDAAKGPVRSPWIAWGPYLWTDGTRGRSQDSLVWAREDVAEDGTHPSPSGRQKVARMLLDFLKQDPAASPWFNGK